MAVFKVKKNKNYTIMSNYHLNDKNLSLKAIGLLSKMLSLPEDWDYTLRGLAAICKEGVGAVESTVNELIAAGYINRVKVRGESGCFAGYDYDVYEMPVKEACGGTEGDTEPCQENPYTENPDTENPDTDNPDTGNPDTDNPDMDKPYPGNPPQLNTNISNTNKLNTNPIISNPIGRADQDMSDEEYEKLIKENIDYDVYASSTERDGDKFRELYEIIYQTVTSKKAEIVVGGEVMPMSRVRDRLLKLDASDLEYVLLALEDTRTPIRNIRKYMLASLFNAKNTKNIYYSQRVRREQF